MVEIELLTVRIGGLVVVGVHVVLAHIIAPASSFMHVGLKHGRGSTRRGTVIARFNDVRCNGIHGLTTLWPVTDRLPVKNRPI